MPEDGLWDRNV